MAAKKKRQDKTPAISADILRDVRCEITDDFEELGQIIGWLREACNDEESGNLRGAAMCAEEAGAVFFKLRDKFEDYAGRCYRFKNWVKEAAK